jgi:hypothetical protein
MVFASQIYLFEAQNKWDLFYPCFKRKRDTRRCSLNLLSAFCVNRLQVMLGVGAPEIRERSCGIPSQARGETS